MSIPVLKVKDENGNIIPIPAIKGDPYILTEADKNEIASKVESDLAEVLASLNSHAESLIGGDS